MRLEFTGGDMMYYDKTKPHTNVSGCHQRFVCATSVGLDPNSTATTYNFVWVKEAKLYAVRADGSEELLSNPPISTTESPPSVGWNVWFSTTHFNHLEDFKFRIKVKFGLVFRDSQSTITNHEVAKQFDLPLRAYNPGWLLATSVGTVQQTVANATCEQFRTKATAANHVMMPANPVDNQTKAGITAAGNNTFRLMTFLGFLTHGEPEGFYDSVTNPGGSSAGFWTKANIRSAAETNRVDADGCEIPPFSMANLWACSAGTTPSGTTSLFDACLLDKRTNWCGRAVTSFTQPLDTHLTNGQPLNKFAEKVFEYLLQGHTLDESLTRTYDDDGLIPKLATSSKQSPVELRLSILPSESFGLRKAGLFKLVGYWDPAQGAVANPMWHKTVAIVATNNGGGTP